MLTDLPNEKVQLVKLVLKDEGYDVEILAEDVADPISTMAKMTFKTTRYIIDGLCKELGIKPKIYTCVALDAGLSYQAVAMKLGEGEYCIVIFFGVTLVSQTTITNLIQSRTIAKLFGYENDKYIEPSKSVSADTYAAFYEIGRTVIPFPESEFLFKLVEELAGHSLEWLVFHELGHILHGHLDFGLSAHGLRYIAESSTRTTSEDFNLTFHALEMDADQFATQYCLQNALVRPSVLDQFHIEKGAAAIEEVRARRFFFCVATMIRGFDEDDFDFENLLKFDHPLAPVRLSAAGALIARLALEKILPFESVGIINIVPDVIVELEEAIFELTGMKRNRSKFIEAITMEFKLYHIPVLARWAKIFPPLSVAKITPKNFAPPQYDPA